ncbi:MAG: N-acetylmuramic acid 6-phosphate etherase [Elusimicrobiota bacterium]|jgi:N-acetylmuramic acid 6-phosphate etherase|nr:N-acetylmuramic acid 6-phosphate etherase [Elusimicrobiota bacterium]
MKQNPLSPTELINKNTLNFAALPPQKMALKMFEESLNAAISVKKALPKIILASKAVAAAYKKNKKIIFIGAGTSGRLGILEAAECRPTFGVPKSAFSAIIAGGKNAVFASVEGAEDSEKDGKADFLKMAKEGDVLIAVAASGNTPYTQGALKAARAAKHKTILITSNKNAAKNNVDILIYLPTGAEVISGSTRLKAATAAKIALNMITTLAMAACGKIYKNYMVDVEATNTKLKARAVRLVAAIAKIPQAQAEALAKTANYNVKAAIVMAKKNIDLNKALSLLKKHKGFLNKIIDED